MSSTVLLALDPGDRFRYTVTHKAYGTNGPSDLRGQVVEVLVREVHRDDYLEIMRIEGIIVGGGQISIRVTPRNFTPAERHD